MKNLILAISNSITDVSKPKGIVFDIDSTLLWNTRRHLAIFREFGQRVGIPELTSLQPLQVEDWVLHNTMRNAGLAEEDVEKLMPRFLPFWQERFFSPHFCQYDEPIVGAVQFVRWVKECGVEVIYCSGRHLEIVEATCRSLASFGFPTEPPAVSWFLKPKFEMLDLDFKLSAAAEISSRWNVIAAFENEPEHLDRMSFYLPEAVHVLLSTNCRDPHYPVKNLQKFLKVENYAKILAEIRKNLSSRASLSF
ncbi:MAG: HAD family hydrolase [Deltaproteobacteria bacterium]|nr:HAD family hydrolase [Deltaproteobacteria bacterium]